MSDSRKKGSFFSITIRPHPDNALLDFQFLKKYFDRNFSESLVSIENKNHYQCAVISKTDKRPDNIKKTLMDCYQKADGRLFTDDERKSAICVKITADIEYTIGYVQKETSPIYNTIKTYDLQKCYEKYKTGIGKFDKTDNVATKFTMNQIAELFVESFFLIPFWNTKSISDYIPTYLREVSPFVSYQTYQKIKQESFLEYLNLRVDFQRHGGIVKDLKTKNKNFINILSIDKNIENAVEEQESETKSVSFEEGLSDQETDGYTSEEYSDNPFTYSEEESLSSEESYDPWSPKASLLRKET